MAQRRRLIAGNWKMNGLTADGLALARGLAERAHAAPLPAELLVCPPATLIARVGEAVAGGAIALGGQDCHPEPSGAHTGDVSAEICIGEPIPPELPPPAFTRTLTVELDWALTRDAAMLSVRFAEPNGTLVVEKTSLIRRERVYPNGPDCDPGCERASIEL